MWWQVASLVAVAGLAVAGLTRTRLAREPEREGPEDPGVVKGYDQLSRGLVMNVERYLTLRALKKLGPAGTLLDVGCGPGYLAGRISRRFPRVRVIGMDINRDMLCRALSNFPDRSIDFCRGDAQALPFPDNAIDFIITTGAFHHWPDGRRSLQEFHRVLIPGGQLLILDLRRDMRRIMYWTVKLLQAFMPADIKRVNGAVGSVWSSYTPEEMRTLMGQSPFSAWRLDIAPGWMYTRGRK
jgi:ubiquinone/menaquinone biosynthesis C-methylase UbiE